MTVSLHFITLLFYGTAYYADLKTLFIKAKQIYVTAKWLKYKETSNKVKGNYFFISQVRKTLSMKTPKIIEDGQFSKRINTQVKR